MIEVVYYRPEHLDDIAYRDFDYGLVEGIRNDMELTNLLNNSNYCYTCFYNGKPILVAGVLVLWKGVGQVFMVSSELKHLPVGKRVSVVRYIKRGILEAKNKFGLHRVQATTLVNSRVFNKFLVWLGFSREGKMSKYGIAQEDYYMYSIS